MTHPQRVRRLFAVLTGLMLLFIWGHSCVPRPASAAESGAMLELLQPLLSLFLRPEQITDHLVRKLAHFAEYGTLGVCLQHLILTYKDDLRGLVLALLTGWLTAFLDETIQIFSGRGSQISDVWLDVSGVLAGLLLVEAFHLLRRAKAKRPRN